MKSFVQSVFPVWLENLPFIEYICLCTSIAVLLILLHLILTKYENWRQSLLAIMIKRESTTLLTLMTVLKSLNTICWHVLIFALFLIGLELASKGIWDSLSKVTLFQANPYYVTIFGGIAGFIIAEALALFRNMNFDFNRNKYRILRFAINDTQLIDQKKDMKLYYLQGEEILHFQENKNYTYVLENQINLWEKQDPSITWRQKRNRVKTIMKNLKALVKPD